MKVRFSPLFMLAFIFCAEAKAEPIPYRKCEAFVLDEYRKQEAVESAEAQRMLSDLKDFPETQAEMRKVYQEGAELRRKVLDMNLKYMKENCTG
jgi:hypothetical protein